MLHDIKTIFHLIIIFQCLFFSCYILSQKNDRRLSNIILAAFLLSKALTEIGGVLAHYEELKMFIYSYAPQMFYIGSPFRYLYVPMLFLYVLSITKRNFHFKKVYLFHFTPFLLISALFMLRFRIDSADTLREILRTGSLLTFFEQLVFDFLENTQFFIYAIASLVVLKKYRTQIKNIYSTIEHIDLAWLNFVIFGFIGWTSLRFLDLVLWLRFGNYVSYNVILYIMAEIVFLIFISLMFFKGIKQPAIFLGYDGNKSRRKYEKTPLADAVREDYENKLLQYMEKQKPYLEPSLCLNDLAKKVAIAPHHISQVLNASLNQNFYDFINSYRIKECQLLLSKQNPSKKTILEILYQIGFNSKSAFNTAFKKHTGMTPTQFRKFKNS
jgi:AraC-like DNA-binding protein